MKNSQPKCLKADDIPKRSSSIGRKRKRNYKKKYYIQRLNSLAHDDISLIKICNNLDHSRRRSSSAPPEHRESRQIEKVLHSTNKENMMDLSSQFNKMSV